MPTRAPSTLLLVLLFLLFAAGLPGAAAAQEAYGIRAGDRVTTQLFSAAGEEVEVIAGERIVDRNGDVFLPLVGSIRVAGLDETGLRRLLTERYATFYDQPVVDVRVQLRVNVTGAVGRPGQYFVDPTATVADALAEAGGVTPELAVAAIQIPSDPENVRLVRDGETLILNLRPEEVSQEVLDMRVQSGDWFHVPYRRRSQLRDDVTFWGSVVSFAASVVGLIVLIGR
jgi:polysaccharide export outer membrane protein